MPSSPKNSPPAFDPISAQSALPVPHSSRDVIRRRGAQSLGNEETLRRAADWMQA